ncbi:MAG: hypothetical protein ACI81T_002049, partial [Bacteroidia bacterium]
SPEPSNRNATDTKKTNLMIFIERNYKSET